MKSYPLHLNLPEFWSRKWKGQNWREWIWQPIPPPTISFSRALRWEKENDKGRKCNLPAAGAWHVENLLTHSEIRPPTFPLPEFWARKWKGQNWREWIWQPIPPKPAKTPQDHPKIPPKSPKIPPKSPQHFPRSPQHPPRIPQDPRKVPPRSFKDNPKAPLKTSHRQASLHIAT